MSKLFTTCTALALASCATTPANDDYYALIQIDESGEEYIVDFNLTQEDCEKHLTNLHWRCDYQPHGRGVWP